VALSTAVSATWALLVVDDAWRGRGLAIADGLAEHLKLPLCRHDVGPVGSEDSGVAAYAVPKLETASVRDADVSSSVAAMP